MRFIDQQAARATAGRRWGVASICAQLGQLGAAISPSTYYAARAATPTKAQLRDEALAAEIARVHADNYGVYGARKGLGPAQPGEHPGRPLHRRAADARPRPGRRSAR